MLGLMRGTVQLLPHEKNWETVAAETQTLLKQLLGETAMDVQHVGSTAIKSICAKPIIDMAVGVKALDDVKPYIDILAQHGIRYRKEDVAEQLLFVIGEGEHRTHHIHVVVWNSDAWKNYLNFRDYLNAFPEKAAVYEEKKMKLAAEFSNDRGSYTGGKQELISMLLDEARAWREAAE